MLRQAWPKLHPVVSAATGASGGAALAESSLADSSGSVLSSGWKQAQAWLLGQSTRPAIALRPAGFAGSAIGQVLLPLQPQYFSRVPGYKASVRFKELLSAGKDGLWEP